MAKRSMWRDTPWPYFALALILFIAFAVCLAIWLRPFLTTVRPL